MTRKTSRDTRREDSLKVLTRMIDLIIIRSIDDYLADGRENKKLRQTLEKVKPNLIKRSLQYNDVINNIEDDKTAILVQDESGALISLAFMLGFLRGTKTIGRHIKKQIRELLKDNTSNARIAALENNSPLLFQKKKIAIDVARSYMVDHPNEKQLTVNALVVQIRSDIEKQCKSNNIPAPSQTSIWTYLNKAKLL